MIRSSAYFLIPSAHHWLAGRIAHQLTSLFLPLLRDLPGSPDRALIGLLPHSFRLSVACPARQTDHSSTYFLISSVRQSLARPIGHRLTSSSVRSSVACLARRMDHASAYFLVPSVRQWLDRRFLGRIARRLTSSFLPLVSGSLDGSLIGLLPRSFRSLVACPARQTDRSMAYFLVPSAHQWLAWLAGQSAHRLTSSFLPLASGLPDCLPDGSHVGLHPHSFRSSMACTTACRTDRSSPYFLVPFSRQWLARRLAGRIARLLTSSFLPLINGLPDSLPGGSLFGFLPHSFRSSVACPTAFRADRSSAYFLVSSARPWLARLGGRIAHRLTSSFLPLVGGSPDGSVIGLLPRSFRSSVACPARRTERSSA